MAEAQSIGIQLDEKSIKILKQVDAIHRDSLINVGLQLAAKTGYFKTLAGLNNTDDLEDVASLDIIDDGETSPKKTTKKAEAKEAPKKPAQTWDSF